MSLPTSQILALASAGFTVEQIDKFSSILDSASAGAPAPAPTPAPAPAQDPEPEPAPAPAEDPVAVMCANFEKQFSEFMATSKQQIAALNVGAAEKDPEPVRSIDDRINDAFASIYK